MFIPVLGTSGESSRLICIANGDADGLQFIPIGAPVPFGSISKTTGPLPAGEVVELDNFNVTVLLEEAIAPLLLISTSASPAIALVLLLSINKPPPLVTLFHCHVCL